MLSRTDRHLMCPIALPTILVSRLRLRNVDVVAWVQLLFIQGTDAIYNRVAIGIGIRKTIDCARHTDNIILQQR